MKRIIVHWTGGTNQCSALDRQHYHWIIDGAGTVHPGKWPELANKKLFGSAYAAHTKGCNTGSIGISLCGMAGASLEKRDWGKYPINSRQWLALVQLVAKRAAYYGIQITPETILSHAEVQGTLGIKQNGKWDISVLPWLAQPAIGSLQAGDMLRREVMAAMARSAPVATVPPPKPATPPEPQKEAILSLSPVPWWKRMFGGRNGPE